MELTFEDEADVEDEERERCDTCDAELDDGACPSACDNCDNCGADCECVTCSGCDSKHFSNWETCENCETVIDCCCECYVCMSCDGRVTYLNCSDCEWCESCGCNCDNDGEGESEFGSSAVAPWEARGITIVYQELDNSQDWEKFWKIPNMEIDPTQEMADFYLLDGVAGMVFNGVQGVRLNSACQVIAAEAKRMSDEKVALLDSVFQQYADMAIGGELRYHRAVGRRALNRHERAQAWCEWRQVRDKVGAQAVADAAELFREMSRGSIGGETWATAADVLHKRLTGGLDARTFVDRMFTLEHNGGQLINKIAWAVKNDMGWDYTRMKSVIGPSHAAHPTGFAALLAAASAPVKAVFAAWWRATNQVRRELGVEMTVKPTMFDDMNNPVLRARAKELGNGIIGFRNPEAPQHLLSWGQSRHMQQWAVQDTIDKLNGAKLNSWASAFLAFARMVHPALTAVASDIYMQQEMDRRRSMFFSNVESFMHTFPNDDGKFLVSGPSYYSVFFAGEVADRLECVEYNSQQFAIITWRMFLYVDSQLHTHDQALYLWLRQVKQDWGTYCDTHYMEVETGKFWSGYDENGLIEVEAPKPKKKTAKGAAEEHFDKLLTSYVAKPPGIIKPVQYTFKTSTNTNKLTWDLTWADPVAVPAPKPEPDTSSTDKENSPW